MTVGTHTWSHKDLARSPYAKDPEKAEWEIEMGNSAVYRAGGKVALRAERIAHIEEVHGGEEDDDNGAAKVRG
jgi:hypothetical protein